MCELPNDTARRKALDNLPRGLNETYERLLRRVNERNEEAQKLVQRVLKWIAHGRHKRLQTSEFCEAVSINIGDECWNYEAVPDKTEILRNCSSLVRLSIDGNYFEFAHFTVEEFLKSIDTACDKEFAAYRIHSQSVQNELAKACLTYLCLRDFDQGGNASEEEIDNRRTKFKFRTYAVNIWWHHAQRSSWDDAELFSLATRLLHPSKPNTFISWAQDISREHWKYPSKNSLSDINRGIADASALHYAAMCGLPKVCGWLLENGDDVNRKTTLGTPLHYALIQGDISTFTGSVMRTPLQFETVKLLLDHKADPNAERWVDLYRILMTPLTINERLRDHGWKMTRLLLEKGAIVDDRCIEPLTQRKSKVGYLDRVQRILKHAKSISLGEKTRGQLVKSCLRAQIPEFTKMLSDKDGLQESLGLKRHTEVSLRTAAEFGQMEVVLSLLDDQSVDVDAAEESTLLTALHYASMQDHVEVAHTLVRRGASLTKTDSRGKTALHHSIRALGCRCLSFLLQQDIDIKAVDAEGWSLWHLAALENNTDALKMLLNQSKTDVRPGLDRTGTEISVVSCASQSGFTINQGFDSNVLTRDGSNAIHCALMGRCERLNNTLDILLEAGVDPFACRKDGSTPVHLLVGDGIDYGNLSKERALRKIAGLSESFPGKQMCLMNCLDAFCRLRPTRHSQWLLTGFRVLLDSGVDLADSSERGVSALKALVDVWQSLCLEQETASRPKASVGYGYVELIDPLNISSEMMLLALTHVPLQGPLHEIYAKPDLLLSSLNAGKEKLSLRLLEHFPDVDKVFNKNNDSVIKRACRSNCSSGFLGTLLERSRALSDKTLCRCLLREVCCGGGTGSNKVLLQLLEAGVDPHSAFENGKTGLMFAAEAGNISAVQSLLASGANAGIKDHTGCNVAHYAVMSGCLDILFALRSTNVDWDARSCLTIADKLYRSKVTLLHLSALLEDNSVLKYLVAENLVPNINSVTDHLDTALMMAVWKGCEQNVAFLLSQNADPMMTDRDGDTALQQAARIGNATIIRLFMDNGCDLKVQNSHGLDCELTAWKHGHTDLAREIAEHNRKQSNPFLSLLLT